MNWLTVIGLCAAGGAIVTVVAFCADVFSWEQTRRAAHLRRDPELPRLGDYIDLFPDVMSCLTRIALGVIAGVVFRSQVTTPLAAFAVGASAPALLTQLGNARLSRQGSEGTAPPGTAPPGTVPPGTAPPGNGTDPAAVPSKQLVEVDMPKSGEGLSGENLP